MHARAAFLSIVLFAGSLLGIDACGSSASDTSADPGDASAASDARTRAAPVDPRDAEPPCDPDADLLARVTDASIADADSTTGLCASCLKRACAEALADCSEDCPCQGIMDDAVDCYLRTRQLGCLGRLANYLVTQETRSRALRVVGCAQSECPVECAVDAGP